MSARRSAPGPTPARVLAVLRDRLRSELSAVAWAAGMARDEATSAESRPENPYDTRALEASYLAAGQGERLAAARALATWAEALVPVPHDRVETGALCEVDGPGGRRWVWFAPRGGDALSVDGATVTLISMGSPLGEALADAVTGDVVEVEAAGGALQTWEILAVS